MLNPVQKFLTLMLFLLITLSALATPQTLTGIVTDTMCGKKHMMPGKSDAECVRECMKHKGNWSYALLVGDKIYALTGDNKQFDNLAGQRVKVTGHVTGDKVAVQSITFTK